MQKLKFHTIGLMSGSSLDGLDIAYCQFNFTDTWKYTLLNYKTASLKNWESLLKNAIHLNKQELENLSIDFAKFLAQEVQVFIEENQIKEIDAVVSHGHTIFHYPEKGVTCQIGDGQTLANLLQLRVINNLRQKDIDAGGQGAPIVPIGDLHLFKDYLVCLNIGGIANLSIKTHNSIIAFDVCTANQVLNYYANKLGFAYDDKGSIASQGEINYSLLDKLNDLDFYHINSPKSLDNTFKNKLIHLIDENESHISDILATYVEHIAIQINQSITKSNVVDGKMLVSGGGAFNDFLIKRLRAHVQIPIEIPNKNIIEYKEAIVMAFIGVLKCINEINVLASVTGAKHNTVCGDVFY